MSASVHAGIHTPPPRSRPPAAEHTGRYGQRAGGTHPTGMQSCYWLESLAWKKINIMKREDDESPVVPFEK